MPHCSNVSVVFGLCGVLLCVDLLQVNVECDVSCNVNLYNQATLLHFPLLII